MDLRNQVGHEAHIGFITRRGGIHARFDYAGSFRCAGFNTVGHEEQSETLYGIPPQRGTQVNRAARRIVTSD